MKKSPKSIKNLLDKKVFTEVIIICFSHFLILVTLDILYLNHS